MWLFGWHVGKCRCALVHKISLTFSPLLWKIVVLRWKKKTQQLRQGNYSWELRNLHRFGWRWCRVVVCVELYCGVCSSGNNDNGDGFDSFAAGRGKRWVGRQVKILSWSSRGFWSNGWAMRGDGWDRLWRMYRNWRRFGEPVLDSSSWMVGFWCMLAQEGRSPVSKSFGFWCSPFLV